MSLIQCSCDCLYQKDGYCKLEKAAEITDCENPTGCLHFKPREVSAPFDAGMNISPSFTDQKENPGGNSPPELPSNPE